MSAEMWWAQTEMVPPRDSIEASWDNNHILLAGHVGPSPHGARTFMSRVVWIYAQFGLGRERQPSERTLFSSYPKLQLNGVVRAYVEHGGAEAIFQTQLVQTGKLDDTPLFPSWRARVSTPLEVATTDPEQPKRERITSSTPLRFTPLNVWLNGTQDLTIQLQAEIVFWVKTAAHIEVEPLAGEPAFSIGLPQWILTEVDEEYFD